MSFLCMQAGEAQPAACDADICVQSGVSNWQTDVSEYCEADVCLRTGLAGLWDLSWDEIVEGRDTIFATDQNPFTGLSDEEFARLATLSDEDIAEQMRLLGQTRIACRPIRFTAELDVPGRDIVNVVFGTAAAAVGGTQQLSVVQIDRIYRSLPGGSTGWWIRWISYRFPGISLISDEPEGFANYETGLYVARLVLLDQEFISGEAADYLSHPACMNP